MMSSPARMRIELLWYILEVEDEVKTRRRKLDYLHIKWNGCMKERGCVESWGKLSARTKIVCGDIFAKPDQTPSTATKPTGPNFNGEITETQANLRILIGL